MKQALVNLTEALERRTKIEQIIRDSFAEIWTEYNSIRELAFQLELPYSVQANDRIWRLPVTNWYVAGILEGDRLMVTTSPDVHVNQFSVFIPLVWITDPDLWFEELQKWIDTQAKVDATLARREAEALEKAERAELERLKAIYEVGSTIVS